MKFTETVCGILIIIFFRTRYGDVLWIFPCLNLTQLLVNKNPNWLDWGFIKMKGHEKALWSHKIERDKGFEWRVLAPRNVNWNIMKNQFPLLRLIFYQFQDDSHFCCLTSALIAKTPWHLCAGNTNTRVQNWGSIIFNCWLHSCYETHELCKNKTRVPLKHNRMWQLKEMFLLIVDLKRNKNLPNWIDGKTTVRDWCLSFWCQ